MQTDSEVIRSWVGTYDAKMREVREEHPCWPEWLVRKEAKDRALREVRAYKGN